MTSANLTQTLVTRVQSLPQLQQQELSASIEDEDLLTNLSPAELQALAGINRLPLVRLRKLWHKLGEHPSG